MSKLEFAHLHLHSEYSLLDGACRVNKLPGRIAELGMNSVAITDHGNMFASVAAAAAFKGTGVKPILGCEIYVCRPGTDRTLREKDAYGRSYYHLVLLAETFEGYANLCKLTSIGYLEGFYNKPRVDMETLAKHSGGLIAMSACLAGCIPKALDAGDHDLARRWADDHLQIFGRNNFFLEIENHGIPQQLTVLRELANLSKDMQIPLVATNDAHYIYAEDYRFHEVMLCMQTGKKITDEKRMRFASDQFYIKSPQQMYDLFPEHHDACRRTVEIADRCNAKVKFDGDYKREGISLLPMYRPEDGSTDVEYLRKITYEGLVQRYGTLNDTIRARADFELNTIVQMGFASYFLVVWDFIKYAKTNGISVGPGRGSAAGAIVAYALQITDIDPLEHSLFFERFLNPERVSMPDIDIDFCFENRGRVIEYVKRKYGVENVGQIITFGTLQPKNAIANVGRAIEIPLSEVNEIKKLIPPEAKPDKARGLGAIEVALEMSSDLRAKRDSSEKYDELFRYAISVEGMPSHCSTHAAGVVIADIPLTDVVPLYRAAGGTDIAVQYTMKQVEKVGLLKMDFLGLKNLTIIENALKSVRQHLGTEIEWEKIGLNDPETYKLLQEGKTFGVFQLESSGMTELVKKLAPTTFSDITALLALYRPGPLGSNMHIDFVECKHGRQRVVFDHPLLEPVLKETYGMILYQEQVMQSAQVLAGYSLGQADSLRRAMGKKDAAEMASARETFVSGSISNGIDGALAGSIFDKIERFADYGFNKSHSAAYAVLSYRTAYLKAHYPVHYLAALMTNAIGGKVEDMAVHFAEAKAMNVRVLPPDVNYSDHSFTVSESSVRFGLAAIKNVGSAAVDAIVAARRKGGAFKDFEDFVFRIDQSHLNSRMYEALIKVGAFDSILSNRSQLMSHYSQVVEHANATLADKAVGQDSIFEGTDAVQVAYFDVGKTKDWPDEVRYEYEKEFLGFYVTGNPHELTNFLCRTLSNFKLADLDSKKNWDKVQFVGRLSNVKTIITKAGKPMAFLDIMCGDDEKIECTAFSESYEDYRANLIVDTLVVINAKINEREGRGKGIVLDSVRSFDSVRAAMSFSIAVTIEASALRDERFLGEFEEILRANPGSTLLTLHIKDQIGTLQVRMDYRMSVGLTSGLLFALRHLPGVIGYELLKTNGNEQTQD